MELHPTSRSDCGWETCPAAEKGVKNKAYIIYFNHILLHDGDFYISNSFFGFVGAGAQGGLAESEEEGWTQAAILPSGLHLCCLSLQVPAQNSSVSAIRSPESPRRWVPKHVALLLGSHRASLCLLLPLNKHTPIKIFQGIPIGRTGTLTAKQLNCCESTSQ